MQQILTISSDKKSIVGRYDPSIGIEGWWQSEQLPGDILTIEDLIWTFGEYCVCRVKMQNGSQSIYFSNGGRTWEERLNVDNIYHIEKVMPGWLFASTSDGWYESVRSGYDWTKITDETAPIGYNILYINKSTPIILAHSGDSINRTMDKGHNWVEVCDLEGHAGYLGTELDSTSSIDGGLGMVFATCGSGLVFSSASGDIDTWTDFDLQANFNGWDASKIPQFTQIAFLEAIAPSKITTRWMARVHLRDSHIARHWINLNANWKFEPIFDMRFSPGMKGIEVNFLTQPGTDVPIRQISVSGEWHNLETNQFESTVIISNSGGEDWEYLHTLSSIVIQSEPEGLKRIGLNLVSGSERYQRRIA